MEVFDLVNNLVDMKKQFEEKTGQEFNILVVWDSIPSTPSSKTEEASDPNRIIGAKGRQLSFCLEKYNPMLKFNKITFIGIDQVRADMQIQQPYAQATEKSVGTFKNMKTATNIYSLQHNIQQWLFLSRGQQLTKNDAMGIDGWYLNVFTEKNKLAVSQHWVSCVFDKYSGLDKFWSEYTFLAHQTPGERKIYHNKGKKMPFPLMIHSSGNQVYLHVKDPNNSEVNYQSEKFFRKDAKEKYHNDENFRQWFDYAMQLSIYYRITQGMFKIAENGVKNIESDSETDESVQFTEDGTPFDAETGEVIDENPEE